MILFLQEFNNIKFTLRVNMEIKPLLQETDDDCGPTCVAMITQQPIYEVKKQIKSYEKSTYMVQIAAYLRYSGLSVIYHYFNPLFLRLSDEGNCSSDQLIAKLYSLPEELKNTKDKRQSFDFMIHYLEYRKEIMEVSMMTTEMVKTVIDMGGCCLTLMTSNYMYPDTPREFNHHYNIIVGYDRDDFVIYDPLYEKELYVNGEKYLHGVYATTGSEMLDTGSILVVYDLR